MGIASGIPLNEGGAVTYTSAWRYLLVHHGRFDRVLNGTHDYARQLKSTKDFSHQVHCFRQALILLGWLIAHTPQGK